MININWIILTFITPLVSFVLNKQVRELFQKHLHKGIIYILLLLTIVIISRSLTLTFFWGINIEAVTDYGMTSAFIQQLTFFSSFSYWILINKFTNIQDKLSFIILINFGELSWFILIFSLIAKIKS